MVFSTGYRKEAKSDGFGFIIITDHEDGINEKWNEYVGQCNDAQSKRRIPVLPGVEIAVKDDEGHALGYVMNENAASVPHNQSLQPQALIDAINDHNPPNSFAVIAHPNGHPSFPGYWNLSSFRAIELLSAEYTAEPETISQWFSLLRRGLSSTLSNGKFVVGLGNSDRHSRIIDPQDITCNWIYTTSYSSYNRNAIWDAIRSGRVSASGRGDLGCFSINNAPQGGVIRATAGGTLSWKLVQKPVPNQYNARKCMKITVYDKHQNIIKTFVNPSKEEIYFNTVAPKEDNFYVVKFDFDYDFGFGHSEVWTNPIFVDVIEPPLDLIFVIDTTGSMWDDIDNVKSSATEIVNTIDSKTSDYRIAVVDYRDFPTYPYGGREDYPYHAVLPFSTDKTAIINAIQSLSLGWGANWKESVNSALIRAIYTEGLGAWRDGVKKAVILMGDAPGHDPEPFTGYTRSSVVAAAEAVDPAVIYAIAISGYRDTYEYFSSLATETEGKVFTAPAAKDVVAAILEAIEEIVEPPGNSPPDCSGAVASLSQLWPPNHKMEAIQILNVTDPDGDLVTITITGITQDEPVSGLGSGDTAPDGSGIGTDMAWVRAERDGGSNGSVYRISFIASDGRGGESSASVLVGVPHDQGVNTVCVDDGQLYDSTVP
ncbi:MAG: VWA domain-containing protein [Bacillota bacterium]